MATNDLAPGFVKLHYVSTTGVEHIMTIPIKNPVLSGGVWNIDQTNGTPVLWNTGIAALIVVMKPFIPPGSSFTFGDLFTKAVGSAPVFVATASFNVVGTAASAQILASQITFSYRDSIGGRGRLVVCDQSITANSKFHSPVYGGNTQVQAVAAYLVSATCVVVSRGGAAPILLANAITKTNDILRKKYGIV